MPARPTLAADNAAAHETRPSADQLEQRRYVAELVAIGLGAGLDRVGVAPATPFTETRQHLEDRKRRGLAADMQFTYRNPARSTDPSATLPGARSLIVAALAYPAPCLDTRRNRVDADVDPGTGGDSSIATPSARVAWYATTDHYAALRAGLDAIAARLRADGYRAVVVADSNALVDREAARRAGLGWYGKNANVLLPGAGSWFVLGSVITDASLPTSGELVDDGCGSCTRCLTECPTGALVEPGVVDARRCLAWLVQAPGDFPIEFREALGDRLYGCDVCQEVCPPNVRTSRASRESVDPSAQRARPPAAAAISVRSGGKPFDPSAQPAAPPRATAVHVGPTGVSSTSPNDDRGSTQAGPSNPFDGRFVALSAVLDATDAELLARFGRWYIPRRDPRYLRRNALVVLGNVGDPHDPDTDRWVRRYLADADPMLRRHAVWAARRLGRIDLLAGVGSDPDPAIAVELLYPVTERSGA